MPDVVHIRRVESRSIIRDEVRRRLEARRRLEQIPSVKPLNVLLRVSDAHLSDPAGRLSPIEAGSFPS